MAHVGKGTLILDEVEALSLATQTPEEMFSVASQMGMAVDISRLLRRRGMEVGDQFPSELILFINTQLVELQDDELVESLQQIRKSHPGRTIVLEIH